MSVSQIIHMVFTYIQAVLVLQVVCAWANFLCEDLSRHPNYDLLDHQDCGLSIYSHAKGQSGLNARIMRGNDAKFVEFPRMAYIVLKHETYPFYDSCDGTLINDIYVLTAAHCLKNGKKIRKVIFGLHNKGETTYCVSGVCSDAVVVGTKEWKIHEKYINRLTKKGHDIALIRLENAVTFNEFIRPICLPLRCDLRKRDFINENMVFAGWGNLEDVPNRREAIALQKFHVTVVRKDSMTMEPRKTNVSIIHDKKIAAGRRDGRATCRGDSGGPLMYWDSPSGRYFEVGVLSYGNPCTMNQVYDHDDVYTRVSYHVPWILDSIRRP